MKVKICIINGYTAHSIYVEKVYVIFNDVLLIIGFDNKTVYYSYQN